MGKTATIAMLAMKFVTAEEGMANFDFVWSIRLKNVDNKSSLADVIKQQHEQLKDVPNEKIQSILQGKTEKETKVALLFDGYDEYQPGRNKDIDKVLESGVGNCFLVLTSRPGYVGQDIKITMDCQVTIEGLSVGNIKKCSQLYMDCKEKSADMLKQAKTVGIFKPTGGFFQRVFFSSSMIDDALLRIPIILLMTCFIYEENQSLPKTRTGVLKTLYTLLGQRSRMKVSGRTAEEMNLYEKTLSKLGQLAWDALQRDELMLKRVRALKCSVIIIFVERFWYMNLSTNKSAKLYFRRM